MKTTLFLIFVMMAPGISTSALAADPVITVMPSSNQVTTSKLKSNAVDPEKLADGAVIAGKIAETAVTEAKIADSSVSGDDFADGSITASKLNLTGGVSAASGETITFNNTMNATEIQNRINQVSRYVPYGTTLTFQFQDGAYYMASGLAFDGFFGGGTIYIQGNTSEPNATVIHASQLVHLDFYTGNCNCQGLIVSNNRAMTVHVRNLKITVKPNYYALYQYYGNSAYTVAYNHFRVFNYNSSSPVTYVGYGANSYFKDNYITGGSVAFVCTYGSRCVVENQQAFNDGNQYWQPGVGIQAVSGVVFRYGNYINGESQNNGGRIFQ